jgi:hypothetical protein
MAHTICKWTKFGKHLGLEVHSWTGEHYNTHTCHARHFLEKEEKSFLYAIWEKATGHKLLSADLFRAISHKLAAAAHEDFPAGDCRCRKFDQVLAVGTVCMGAAVPQGRQVGGVPCVQRVTRINLPHYCLCGILRHLPQQQKLPIECFWSSNRKLIYLIGL